MDKIKLGLIGTGLAFERLHFPAFNRLKENYEIVAVCDKDIKKAQKAAGMLAIDTQNVYTDYNKMLNDVTNISSVDIMVPISENYEVAKDVITKGKHVIAEKPFSATISGAKDLMKLAKKHNVKIIVAENYRYSEENTIIKKLIDDKAIGTIAYFIDNNVTEFTKDMIGDTFAAKEWRQHPEFFGGIFLDSGVHHIARQRFLFGDAIDIFAKGIKSKNDFCPYSSINALISFKKGITGHYSFFNIAKETQAPLIGFRIFGTNGEIYLEDKDCGFVNLSLKDGTHQAIPYKPEEGYYNELLNFYNALANNETIVSTPEKELGDIQIIQDILKSIEDNCITPASNKFKRS